MKTYEINVSFDNSAGDGEAPICVILDRYGYEQTAAGGGDWRDMHFSRDAEHDDEELDAISAALKALKVDMTATAEVWIEKGDDSEPDESAERTLVELEDA